MKHRLSTREVTLFLAGAIAAGLLVTPAGAHVTTSVKHLWGKHIKPQVTKLVYTKARSNARYLGKTATAANSDQLDGKDSSAFAASSIEAWREVGASGEPPFDQAQSNFCQWRNYDTTGVHTTVAFAKDPFGVVRLKGLAQMIAGTSADDCGLMFGDGLIFTLPEGYRPGASAVFTILSNSALARITVQPDGGVEFSTPGTTTNAREWASLDGIDFIAAAPSVAATAAKRLAAQNTARSR